MAILREVFAIVLLAVVASFTGCEALPPDAPPRPPPKPEMSTVLPSWSTMTWVMGYWKWSGTEWVWIPGHLAPKP
ncbi:CDI system lipoprotein BcpO [Burkholderia ubonensis]|uniref:CDI system lipoprotein BcpO n=1 Tax=Burkholderia ubonensis TaxID=101571 RepID=UPI0009B2FE35|nr:CDI system lipoprotein BcpO [Burkholderia ubonensis]